MRRNEWLEKQKCEADVFTASDQRKRWGELVRLPFPLPGTHTPQVRGAPLL